jgi:FkbM family methyltransferase
MICSRSDRVSRVLAFEPNPNVREIFCRNVRSLPNGEPHALAVSNFIGFGRLERPGYATWSDHALYLQPAQMGIPVTTIDSFESFDQNVAIKIDVEGGELDVIRGAETTIRRAPHCILTLEAHPQVYARTGTHPRDCLSLLESLRPFSFVIAETGQRVTATDEILDGSRVLNILGMTLGS